MAAGRLRTTGSQTAGELLAEGGQLLVAGERAAGLGGLTATGRGVLAVDSFAVFSGGGGAGLGFGGSGLDLLHVRLVAGVCLGVLALPLLTLLVEAFLPFLGVRFEALGADVVALGVVLGGHTVMCRV